MFLFCFYKDDSKPCVCVLGLHSAERLCVWRRRLNLASVIPVVVAKASQVDITKPLGYYCTTIVSTEVVTFMMFVRDVIVN